MTDVVFQMPSAGESSRAIQSVLAEDAALARIADVGELLKKLTTTPRIASLCGPGFLIHTTSGMDAAYVAGVISCVLASSSAQESNE